MGRWALLCALHFFLVVAPGCSKARTPELQRDKPLPQANSGPSPALALPSLTPKPALPSATAEKRPTATPTASKIEGQGFVVEVIHPKEVPLGTHSAAQVVLRPTSGYHVNKDFPIMLEVSPPDGVEVEKRRQLKGDAKRFGDNEAAFDLGFMPKATGEKKFTALFKFAVCTETTCDPKRETLAWNVIVK
ncbi:MAG: hypothetical protein HY698_04530 [Deltaproteobacteria bacterium]|nr:hypothetical protein [Deltaproteobacteria bacterium]